MESARNLKRSRPLRNASVLSRLKEDEYASELMRVGKADADKNRMSEWVPMDADSVRCTSVSPRFGVPQGGYGLIFPIPHSSLECTSCVCLPQDFIPTAPRKSGQLMTCPYPASMMPRRQPKRINAILLTSFIKE